MNIGINNLIRFAFIAAGALVYFSLAPASAQVVYSGQSIPTRPAAPTNSIGVDNSWYLDLTTGIVFGPKTGGVWPPNAFPTLALADLSNVTNPLPIRAGGTGSTSGDITNLVVTPTGGPTPVALADVAASALSHPSITGSIAENHIVIGGPTPGTIQDSGHTQLVSYNAGADPGVLDDSTRGYIPGSTGYNNLTGNLFVCISNAPAAAVWQKVTSPAALPSTISWSFNQALPGTTNYTAPAVLGPNSNYEGIAATPGIFSHMYLHTGAQPGGILNYTFKLCIGTPGTLGTGTTCTATGITCVMTGAVNDCSDITHTAAITAGQAFSIQLVTDPLTPNTVQGGAGLMFTPQ